MLSKLALFISINFQFQSHIALFIRSFSQCVAHEVEIVTFFHVLASLGIVLGNRNHSISHCLFFFVNINHMQILHILGYIYYYSYQWCLFIFLSGLNGCLQITHISALAHSSVVVFILIPGTFYRLAAKINMIDTSLYSNWIANKYRLAKNTFLKLLYMNDKLPALRYDIW